MNKLATVLIALFIPFSSAFSEPLRRAEPGYAWSFPRDHGRHSDFQTEWWYYTGQLFSAEDDIFRANPRYGFQLTFFRRSLVVGEKIQDQYMAHAVVSDLRLGKTFFSSRIGGGDVGLAGASASCLRVWSGDWTVDSVGADHFLRFSVPGDEGEYVVRLSVRDAPAPWLQGEQGWSRKANCSGCASQYYSLPRLALTAEVTRDDSRETLRGLGWMDHEFMTNVLADSQVGWDWMGLMLEDGRSLMVYRLRRADGTVDFAAGSLRSPAGQRVLNQGDFIMTPLTSWRSPSSNAEYPTSWRVEVPAESIKVEVSAQVTASELGEANQVRYWEGPVASEARDAVGYLEMTGYSERVRF